MISIDFVAGSHGHFLEFICNKFLTNLETNFLPFNLLGASHNKTPEYEANKIFSAKHYSELGINLSDRIIRITFDEDDLLTLLSGALLRAGNVGINNDELETDTYNKLLNSKHYSLLINNINTAYPEYIISKENPNCPRYILREFFKFGFKHPESHGLMKKLKELKYPNKYDVIDFSYKSFYNYKLFLQNIKKIELWYGQKTIEEDVLYITWHDFIQRQIFKDHKSQCDSIIKSIVERKKEKLPKLSLLQESYVNGMLEQQFNTEMPFHQDTYFKSTDEIIKHLCLK